MSRGSGEFAKRAGVLGNQIIDRHAMLGPVGLHLFTHRLDRREDRLETPLPFAPPCPYIRGVTSARA